MRVPSPRRPSVARSNQRCRRRREVRTSWPGDANRSVRARPMPCQGRDAGATLPAALRAGSQVQEESTGHDLRHRRAVHRRAGHLVRLGLPGGLHPLRGGRRSQAVHRPERVHRLRRLRARVPGERDLPRGPAARPSGRTTRVSTRPGSPIATPREPPWTPQNLAEPDPPSRGLAYCAPMSSLAGRTIATVGSGVMAEAIIAGLLRGQLVAPDADHREPPATRSSRGAQRTHGIRTIDRTPPRSTAPTSSCSASSRRCSAGSGASCAVGSEPGQLVISILAGATTRALDRPPRPPTRWSGACPTRRPSWARA